MLTSLLLTAALTGGQPPASYPYPPGGIPVLMPAGQPGALPPTLPVIIQDPPKKDDDTGERKDGNDARAEEKKDDPPPPQKYFLEKSLAETRLGNVLTNNGITVYGWTDMSFNASTASKSNRPPAPIGANAPVFMIDQANQFLLNQNFLVVEKTLDITKKETQWGFRTDWVLPGSDARTSVVRGLWSDQLTKGTNGGPILYPIDPYQFYGQLYLPDLGQGTTVKVGRFATHISYEVFQGVDRPFVSMAYIFQYNPFTHTGIWATTQLNDTWSVGNGLATGNDTFIDPANRPTYLGQIKWAPKDGKTSALFNVSLTNPQYNVAEAFPFYNVYNFQVLHKFSDKLNYVWDSHFSNIQGVPGIGNTNWYGAANYFFYTHNPKLISTLRAEVFEDTSGFRTGFKGLYSEVTYGVTYKAGKNGWLWLRPSVRYDNNANTGVWEGNPNLFTAAMEVIMRW
jgi:hypothetical protein